MGTPVTHRHTGGLSDPEGPGALPGTVPVTEDTWVPETPAPGSEVSEPGKEVRATLCPREPASGPATPGACTSSARRSPRASHAWRPGVPPPWLLARRPSTEQADGQLTAGKGTGRAPACEGRGGGKHSAQGTGEGGLGAASDLSALSKDSAPRWGPMFSVFGVWISVGLLICP